MEKQSYVPPMQSIVDEFLGVQHSHCREWLNLGGRLELMRGLFSRAGGKKRKWEED
jgi:hypothetical protein